MRKMQTGEEPEPGKRSQELGEEMNINGFRATIRLRDPTSVENRINAGVTEELINDLQTWKCFEITDSLQFTDGEGYEFNIWIIGIPTDSWRVEVTVSNAMIVIQPVFAGSLNPSNIGLHDPNYKSKFRNELKKHIHAFTHRMRKNLELIEEAVRNAT